jgi:hypothetical protein
MNKSDNLTTHPQRTKITLRSPLTSETEASPTDFSEFSEEESSNYRRYLSHLEAERSVHGDERAVFWDIVSKCILYLKREHLND